MLCRKVWSEIVRKNVSFQRHARACRNYSVVSSTRPLRLAIIGSGPAGYYSAYRIMKKTPEAYVDMFESLPVPYGLVRYGVAPDHPEVKKSSETLDDVAKWPNFNWVGNVKIGNGLQELPLKNIAEHYDGILFAYGASKDKLLGVEGEGLPGIYSARDFVGWYNGLPDSGHMKPDLSGEQAVILGQGNVALDVARALLTPVDELRKTDMSERALAALSKSKIKSVKIVGRRGPLQAPATIKELRELMTIPGSCFQEPNEGWSPHTGMPRKSLPRQLKRIMELLEKGSNVPLNEAQKTWQLRYLLSPSSFTADQDSNTLSRVNFEKTGYVQSLESSVEQILAETSSMPEWEKLPAIMNKIRALKVKGTGETESIPASIALRSIGYLSTPLEGLADLDVPFDEKLGIIPNDIMGRVLSPNSGPGSLSAGHLPGYYVAGWIKRGPTGVIASTLDDAFRTADTIVSDWQNNVAFRKEQDGRGLDALRPLMAERGIRAVDWSDWERINTEEKRRGVSKDKVREKITNIDEMLAVVGK